MTFLAVVAGVLFVSPPSGPPSPPAPPAAPATASADSLDVTIRGTGDVTYIGSPSVSQHVAGTGSVMRAG
jgi:hypothetical protein